MNQPSKAAMDAATNIRKRIEGERLYLMGDYDLSDDFNADIAAIIDRHCRMEEAVKALEPLAERAEPYQPEVFGHPCSDDLLVTVRLGHLRKARALLATPTPPTDE